MLGRVPEGSTARFVRDGALPGEARYRRQRRTTIMLAAPQGFLDQILWPEFVQINEALTEYLAEITEKIIRDEVYGETGEAEEVDEPPKLGR
jgi:hypothetical protein